MSRCCCVCSLTRTVTGAVEHAPGPGRRAPDGQRPARRGRPLGWTTAPAGNSGEGALVHRLPHCAGCRVLPVSGRLQRPRPHPRSGRHRSVVCRHSRVGRSSPTPRRSPLGRGRRLPAHRIAEQIGPHGHGPGRCPGHRKAASRPRRRARAAARPRTGRLRAARQRGKIVVTPSVLKVLSPAERRALIAHEQAHLTNHHQLYIQAAGLDAAANPFLIPAARQVRLLVERWADEDAALEVNDRLLTARALAKAALARRASQQSANRPPRFALPSAEHAVTERALALTRPAPAPRRSLSNAILTLAASGLLASAVIAHTTETRFEQAHDTYLVALIGTASLRELKHHAEPDTVEDFGPGTSLPAPLCRCS